MEPQPPLPLANGHGNSIVDRDVWLACAAPLSRLPTVGDDVYYFPDGHAEQCPAHLPAPLPAPHFFPCTVTDISLGADDKTDEVFAKISLRPGLAAASRPDPGSSNSPPREPLSYSIKELSQSDANGGGSFCVPRYCGDHVWPKVDFEADPPMQNLVMHDTTGKQWEFRHVYRAKQPRHVLTTGWSKFVNAKLLVAGDIIVFMRRPNGDLIVGLRRMPRYAGTLHRPGAGGDAQDPDQPPRNALARVPPKDVMEAARLAAEGRPFTVTYYPRKAAGEFVVPRNEVEGVLDTLWEPGSHVLMQFAEAEDTRRTMWADGHVKAIHQKIWRALEVLNYDDPYLANYLLQYY
jgi:hypothetical protein